MYSIASPLVLFAQENRLSQASEQFRHTKGTFTLEDLVLGVGLFLAAGFGLYLLSKLISRRERRQTYYHPRKLFDELCTAHALNRSDRRVLLDLARFHDLDDPGRLFLEPDRFDKSHLDEELLERASELFAIRDTLFASPEGDGSPWLGVRPTNESSEPAATAELS